MRPLLLPAVLCLLAPPLAIHPQTPHNSTLLVVNQTDHTLSLIDPKTNRELAAIDVGGVTGHEVATIPGAPFAYVPIYGDSGVGRPGTDGSRLVEIDLPTRRISRTLDFGYGIRPHCIVYNPQDRLLYVTTELDQSITLVDRKSFTVAGVIPTGRLQSHMLVLSHDGRFGYTANVASGSVSVLDLRARTLLAVVPVAAPTQRISISADDKYVFTADQTRPRLAIIDTASRTLKQWLPLPAVGYGTATTADGRWLLVALRTAHRVAVVDLRSLTVASTIDLPGAPTEILITPDGGTAYLSCDQTVAILDIPTWKLTGTLQAGRGADGLAWAQ